MQILSELLRWHEKSRKKINIYWFGLNQPGITDYTSIRVICACHKVSEDKQEVFVPNPTNRMRLASVTKSQLSRLQSALEGGGVFIRANVYGRGRDRVRVERVKVLYSFIINLLHNSLRGSLFPATLLKASISSSCWYFDDLRGFLK